MKSLTPHQINFLQEEGLTQKKIGEIYHRDERTIRRWKTKPLYEIKSFRGMAKPLLLTSSVLALDECSFHLNETPRHSYALKGWRASYRKPGGKGKNHTLILCIRNVKGKGVIYYELIPSGMKTKEFHEFLTNLKLPSNEKHYLMMDNLKVHRATKSCQKLKLSTIRELLDSKNIQPTYLPPYSPELNPTELCFNNIRKSIENQRPRTFEELKLAIGKAIASLQEKDMTEYFRHCFDCFDENGILTNQNKKREKQGISNSNKPHFLSQIVELFKLEKKLSSEKIVLKI